MGSIQELETVLDKLADSVATLKAAQGSIVKLPKAEIEVLTLCAKLHEIMTADVQDDGDRDREKLIHLYGGDGVRIERARSILESIHLSEENAADPRVPTSLNDCSIIEGILDEKNFRRRLSKAFGACFCFSSSKSPSEQNTTSLFESKPPAHAPAPAPVPAPRPALKSVTSFRGQKTETYVKTRDSDKHKTPLGHSETKRTVAVEAEVEVAPTFDFGEAANTWQLEVDTLKVTLRAKVSPPLPEDPSIKKHQPVRELSFKMPKLKKYVFNGNTGKPEGGRVECVLKEWVSILELPGNIDATATFRTQAPWGSQELYHGNDETVMHYDVKAEGKFTTNDGDDDSTLLYLEMVVIFAASLSGVGSKKFSSDGKPLPAPSHPGA